MLNRIKEIPFVGNKAKWMVVCDCASCIVAINSNHAHYWHQPNVTCIGG